MRASRCWCAWALTAICLVPLEAQAQTQRLVVRVTQQDGLGAAIEGAWVTVSSTLIVGDDKDRLQGATGPDGMITLVIPNHRAGFQFTVTVRKEGYDPKSVSHYASGPQVAIAVQLRRKPGVFATVAVSSESGAPIAGANVRFVGEGILGLTYEGTTNANGSAVVFVEREGSYRIEVSHDAYEAHTQPAAIRAGGNAAQFASTLNAREARGEAEVSKRNAVTVAVTAKSGPHAGLPIPGATIQIGSSGATTDERGRAVVWTSMPAGDDIPVTASAPGYVAATKVVSLVQRRVGIANTAATGNANFELEPDAEAALTVVFSVRDAKTDEAIVGAFVDLTFSNGRSLKGSGTDAQGQLTVTLGGDPAVPASVVRQGFRYSVFPSPDKYPRKTGTVPSSLLAPSPEPRHILVSIESHDSTDELGKLIADFRADLQVIGARIQALKADWDEAQRLVDQAGGNLKALTGLKADADSLVMRLKSLETVCQQRQDVVQAAARAVGLEQQLRNLLDEASRLAEACRPDSTDRISQGYRNSIQLLNQLGDLERSVRRADVVAALQQRDGTDPQALVSELERTKAKMGPLRSSLTGSGRDLTTVVQKGRSVQPQLREDFAGLMPRYADLRAKAGDELLREVWKQYDQFQWLLGSLDFGQVSLARIGGMEQTAAQTDLAIDAAVLEARALAAKPAIAGCAPVAHTQVADEIGERVTSAALEVAAAADLPRKAEQCRKWGECGPMLNAVRPLLEQGAIADAEALLNQARAKNCDARDSNGLNLSEELDYFRTIRDAVVYIKTLGQACRFQDAVNVAGQLPARARSLTYVNDAVNEARSGSVAQREVLRLLDMARRSAEPSQQRQLVQQAAAAAFGFVCLTEQVGQFQAAEVEQLPDAVDKPVPPQPKPLPPPGQRPCDAAESAAFSQMSGSWKPGPARVTISGSCENASGTYVVAEYCENPDATYNQTLARYAGTFKGRMNGDRLNVSWELPASSVHPRKEGTASCSVSQDGTLSCSGFNCAVNAKR